MKRTFILLQAAMLLAGSAYAGRCTNPNLTWELRQNYTVGTLAFTSRVTPGDAKGAYIDGADGVTGVLHHCSGSYDANLDTGTRTIKFDFGAALSGTVPTWNTTGVGGIQVRRLRHLDASVEGAFTTWMTSSVPSPKKKAYKLRMFNPDTDASGGTADNAAIVNNPYTTAKVNVYHCPGNNPAPASPLCNGLTKETWFVYPDPTPTNGPFSNVGALVDVTSLTNMVNVGQFEMPFYFVISIK